MLLLFECITCTSSLSMEEIKLFAIVNWIFCVSDFLKLFWFMAVLVIYVYGLLWFLFSDTVVKNKLQVTSCKLRITSYKLEA